MHDPTAVVDLFGEAFQLWINKINVAMAFDPIMEHPVVAGMFNFYLLSYC